MVAVRWQRARFLPPSSLAGAEVWVEIGAPHHMLQVDKWGAIQRDAEGIPVTVQLYDSHVWAPSGGKVIGVDYRNVELL